MRQRDLQNLLLVVVLAVAIVFLASLPASAHTDEGKADWYADWAQRAQLGITIELMDELREFTDRHEVKVSVPVRTPVHGPAVRAGVEQWRGLVASQPVGWHVDTMLCLMGYESGGNPNALNPSSGAAGLLQVMPFWWDHYGGDRFDPATNVAVAGKIWLQQGYRAWSPYNRGLCR